MKRKPKTAPKLTRKQKAFADELISNPKQSATQSALKVYNTTSYHTAGDIAHQNLKNPEIRSYLDKHSKKIEEIIASKTYELTTKEDIQSVTEGLKNARWMHDKIHGKATQKVEQQSTSVNINIDLTQEQ